MHKNLHINRRVHSYSRPNIIGIVTVSFIRQPPKEIQYDISEGSVSALQGFLFISHVPCTILQAQFVAINNPKQSGKYMHHQRSHAERTTVKAVMQYRDSIKAFFTFRPSYGVSYRHEFNFINTYERERERGGGMVCRELDCKELAALCADSLCRILPTSDKKVWTVWKGTHLDRYKN
jgi:hypothetical protein